MVITFDPVKRAKNLHDRQLDFLDAEIVLSGPGVHGREHSDRLRRATVGFLAGRMVMVGWTPRGEAVHVMSMRKCNDKEQARYSKRFEEG